MGAWGGRRSGAGRKPTPRHVKGVTGDTGKRGTVLQHPRAAPASTATSEIEEFDAPDHLTMEERRVWACQAPYAFKARTLTRATALSFERYCRLVVDEREMRNSVLARNGADHRGLIRQVNSLESQFLLTAGGKAMYEAEPQAPANPLSKFLSGRKA